MNMRIWNTFSSCSSWKTKVVPFSSFFSSFFLFLVFLGCLKIAGRFEPVPHVHFDGGAGFIH